MPWTSEFRLDKTARTIHLVPEDSIDLAASSAAAMMRLLKAAQDTGSFMKLCNWPGERFPVLGAPFAFSIDRALAPYFGTVTSGSQLTIFVRGKGRSIAGIWIARRADDKATFPGKLDNAVGGAIKQSEMPLETLLREGEEELGIDVQAAVSGGTISWFNVKVDQAGFDADLVEPGVQFVFDLEVDATTVLQPAEDGIDWIRLLTIEDVKAALLRNEFKPSCACVMIDFFVRHGIINAENDEDFTEIVSRLHRRLPLPIKYPTR